jgi:predicted dehydrogenase
MNERALRIGLIGFGGMGRMHAEQISYIENAVVAGVIEPGTLNRTKAQAFFSGQEVAFFEDVDSALEQLQVDGWIVTSSTNTHIEITKKLLENGCTVLLEKPIASTLLEAEKLQALVKPDSSNLMMGHILLWNKEFQAMKSEATKLGKITAINCSRQRSADHRTRYPGESPFAFIMVHDLYTVHSLVEAQEPKTFSAQQRSHDQGGVDLAQAQIGWSDNTYASLVANYLIPDDIPGGGNIDELTIAGESWHMRLLYESGVIQIASKGEVRQVKVDPPKRVGATNFFDDALRNELEHFLLLIRGVESVPVGARYQDACQIQGWIGNFISLTQDEGAK